MASGTIYGTTNTKFIRTRIVWESVPDQEQNKSTVYCIYSAIKSSEAGVATYAQGTWSINVGGVTAQRTITVNLPPNNTWVEIGRIAAEIEHDPDGSKSIQIVGTGGMTGGASWKTTNMSGVAVLDRIPRGTVPVVDSVADFGSTITIGINPAEETFHHTVSVRFITSDFVIARDYTSGILEFEIPTGWMNTIPNAETSQMIITTTTFNGGFLVGYTSKIVTLHVPDSITPQVNSVSLTDSGGLVPPAWGFVKTQSILHVDIDAEGLYGAEIVDYQIDALGETRSGNNIDVGTINVYGTIEIGIAVTDTRGRVTRLTLERHVIDYTPPIISSIFMERANNQGQSKDNGTYLKLTLSAEVASIESHNNMVIRIYHQRSDEKYRTLARTITPSELSVNEATYLVGNMEASRTYEITVEVSDYFENPTTATGILPAEGGVLSWKNGGTGLAIGKAAEEDYRADFGWKIHGREGATFDVPLDIESGGTNANNAVDARENLGIPKTIEDMISSIVPALVVDHLYPVGSLYITTNATDPSEIFADTTWERIKDTFLIASGDAYSAGSTGGASEYELKDTHKHLTPIGSNHTAMGVIDINGVTYGGNGRNYETAQIDHSGKLPSDVQIGYTDDVTIEYTIPTIPPYLAVYVWKRTA